jgi:hypothetical protein
VKIKQKIIKYRPVDKWLDGYIALLTGAEGMRMITYGYLDQGAVKTVFSDTKNYDYALFTAYDPPSGGGSTRGR